MAQQDHGKEESSRRARWAQDNFRVAAEGAAWVVVDKPTGLLIHPTRPDGAPTLWGGLRQLLAYDLAVGGQLSIITRLDRETSGLVLVARTSGLARAFSAAMQRGEIIKDYLALVQGWPEWEEKVIEAPIIRQGEVRPSDIWLKRCVEARGAPSLTEVRVEDRLMRDGQRIAVVRARPRTGRTHQIRVHLAAVGHSIIGDKIYGPREGAYLDFLTTGWTPDLAAELVLPRHALHACGIRFDSPEGRQRVEVGWPEDLRAFLETAASLREGAN